MVPSETVRSRNPISLARTGIMLAGGTGIALNLMRTLKPAAVVGFGGYPTLPPLVAARLFGVPTVIHDSNAVMGRANRLLSGYVSAIATSQPGALDRARLSKLRPGAYLINVARGAHVAEPDLLALIKSGQIAAATLDVFRNEPLPAQHPFWLEPRISITPHISALTLRRESIAQIVTKIRQFEAGQPVDDIVDRNRGY